MVSKGPGPGPGSVRENRATGTQPAARSEAKKLSGVLRVRRRRPREEGEREGRGGGGRSEAELRRCEAPAGPQAWSCAPWCLRVRPYYSVSRPIPAPLEQEVNRKPLVSEEKRTLVSWQWAPRGIGNGCLERCIRGRTWL